MTNHRSILRDGAFVLSLLVVASAVVGGSAALFVALGGIAGLLNFWILARLVVRVTESMERDDSAMRLMGILVLKMGVLIGTGLLMVATGNPFAAVIGFSCVVVTITARALLDMVRGDEANEAHPPQTWGQKS